jgi:hypothetical protein
MGYFRLSVLTSFRSLFCKGSNLYTLELSTAQSKSMNRKSIEVEGKLCKLQKILFSTPLEMEAMGGDISSSQSPLTHAAAYT